MRWKWCKLLIAALFLVAGDAFPGYELLYSASGVSAEAVSGEVILRFRSGVTEEEAERLISGAPARVAQTQPALGIKRVVSSGKSTSELVSYFRALDEVAYAVPNYIVTASSYKLPGDYATLELLENSQWGLSAIGSPAAWDITTGSGILIAVLDTGIDINHEKLSNNIWVNPDPLSPLDFGGGYIVVNDTHGWNFVDNTNLISTSGVHGTHVAGIIAGEEVATSAPASGFVGVNWNARIMAVEVLGPGNGSGTTWDLAAGIVYAAVRGADIINMSLGYPSGIEHVDPVEEACGYAYGRGVLIISSSGNEDGSRGYGGGIGQPASYSTVMAVASSARDGSKSDFSSYGAGVEITAPGSDIRSSLPGNSYGSLSGTSMAAPFVSGAASLVISVWKGQGLDWNPGQVRRALTLSAERPSGGRDRYLGYGHLDLYGAVTSASAVQSNTHNSRTLVYPNPFYPDSGQEVSIVLPEGEAGAARRLRIYALDGTPVLEREVLTLPVSWDGRNSYGKICASGLYFFYLETESGGRKGKITLVR